MRSALLYAACQHLIALLATVLILAGVRGQRLPGGSHLAEGACCAARRLQLRGELGAMQGVRWEANEQGVVCRSRRVPLSATCKSCIACCPTWHPCRSTSPWSCRQMSRKRCRWHQATGARAVCCGVRGAVCCGVRSSDAWPHQDSRGDCTCVMATHPAACAHCSAALLPSRSRCHLRRRPLRLPRRAKRQAAVR